MKVHAGERRYLLVEIMHARTLITVMESLGKWGMEFMESRPRIEIYSLDVNANGIKRTPETIPAPTQCCPYAM